MDLHPPSKEETPSYVKFERRPRRVLGDFNTSIGKRGERRGTAAHPDLGQTG